MFEKNNSIKDILKEAKDKLSKDKSLFNEKEEFNQRLAKALDGNVLVLNKVYGSDSNSNIDQRSKKITEIIEHQSALVLNNEIKDSSARTLLLEQEVSRADDVLTLENEVEEDDALVLNQEYEGLVNQALTESQTALEEIKERLEQKDPFIERIEQLEEKQIALFAKLDEAFNEIKSKDPTEDIALKFDILTNQIGNEIDEKIEKIKNDIQENNEQKNQLEERIIQIESSSESLKNSVENLDYKIEDLTRNINESLSQNIQEQIKKFEQSQLVQDEKINSKLQEYEKNIESRFDVIQHQVKTSIDQFNKFIEEEKLRKEEDKKNDPEYQSNLRLNNIYKILEMQISQSLVNNFSNHSIPQNITSPSNADTPTIVKSDNSEVLQKLEDLKIQLNNKIKIDDNGIKEIFSLTNSKISKLEEKINENQSSLRETFISNQDKIINYFKSNELKSLQGLSLDLSSLREFDNMEEAKSFIENIILKETQTWIKNNQKSIEDICNKIIYK